MTSLYITESGSFIKRRGGHVVIGRNNETLMEVPLERVEDVSVIDSVQISSELITEFLKRGVPVTWLSGYGRYFGTLISTQTTDIAKQQKQFEWIGEKTFYLALAKKIIHAKTNNQLVLLKRYARNAQEGLIDLQIKNIRAIRRNINTAKTSAELMGYEGIISRLYFEALGKLVPEEFSFTKRSKQPPLDPFNAMLGLGYSMLFNEIMSNIMSIGLHPFVGCLHSIAKGHPALVSDLIEEWRSPIIDSMVLALVKRHSMDTSAFDTSDKGCFLNYEGRKLFLARYNAKIRTVNQYLENGVTYRECIANQCRNYARAITHGDIELYNPLEIY